MPEISQILKNKFPFRPTSDQSNLFLALGEFLAKKQKRQAMIIKGYAGVGKTTAISALVKTLPLINYKYLLLAPTGRAAKVASVYSGKAAFTIHKKIYKAAADPSTGAFKFIRQKNYHSNTVFIIDEASMLADDKDYGGASLLSDLMDYVFEHDSNKMILVGDSAQLPPVGQEISPALDVDRLSDKFGVDVSSVELTEVLRQELNSGILYNATRLRNLLKTEKPDLKFTTNGYKDVYQITGEKLEDGLRYAYKKYGVENTVVICRSNLQAVKYNEYIRRTIHFYEDEIEAGDLLMVVRNNYFYLPEDSPAGFLANGDFVEVMKIVRYEELYGFRFATLLLTMPDYPETPAFEAKVILKTLHSYTPSLSAEDSRTLYFEVAKDYADIKSKRKRNEEILANPYLNALQIKFAYALTCHKAQGGQWNCVFLDQGFLASDTINAEYLRWLYTGVTRAMSELYLVNFKTTFFSEPSLSN